MTAFARRLGPTWEALRHVARNRDLLRLEVASFVWMAAEGCYLVGLLVLAYAAGGTDAVALVAILRALPSVVLAPLVLSMTDAVPRDRLLRLVVGARVLCAVALTVLVGASLDVPPIYAIAAADAVAASLLRPLRSTLVPALARSPEELVAANVATSTGDSLAALIGPGLAAIILVVATAPVTFVAGTLAMATALVAVVGLRAAPPLTLPAATTRADATLRGGGPPARVGFAASVRQLLALPHARLVVTLFAAQRLVRGMLAVLLVAAAFEVLRIGDPGVGALTSAMGFGGLVGGAVALGLIGRRRLAPAFLGGLLAWSGGIALAGIVPAFAVVVAFLAIAGVGKVVLDVSGSSLIQRTVPTGQRSRVFGLLEGIVTAALAAGPLLATFLVGAVGAPLALVIAGAIPAVLAIVAWPVLSSADAAVVVPERDMRLLSGVAMFRPLQLTTIEQLAGVVERQTVAAGEDVVREGETGETFFIVESGRLEAVVGGRPVSHLAPGDSFGEIALLRDMPRTATIRTLEACVLVTVRRAAFLAAVASESQSSAIADEVVRSRLASS